MLVYGQPDSMSATMPRMQPVDTSIVVPCFNSKTIIHDSLVRLSGTLQEAKSTLGNSEIIVVDDGSTDDSSAIVEKFTPEVRLIRLDRNWGKGAAVRTGMLAASGSVRFFTDADVPYDLTQLCQMHAYLTQKEFDLVIGARDPDNSAHFAKRSLLRRWTSSIFTEFVSRLVITGVRDTQCGLKGFRADVAEYLFSQSRIDGFAFDVELLYLAYKNDLDIKRVRVKLVRDDHSTVSVVRHGAKMLLDVLALPIRFHSGGYKMMNRPER